MSGRLRSRIERCRNRLRPPGAGHTPPRADHGFRERDLVSDIPGRAEKFDPNLVNSWGLVREATGEILVSDNGSDKATAYSGAVDDQPVDITPLVVPFPDGVGDEEPPDASSLPRRISIDPTRRP